MMRVLDRGMRDQVRRWNKLSGINWEIMKEAIAKAEDINEEITPYS